jgi:siroheme synthase (precorrin-2 oxidase/ferrochelatase)
VGGGNVGLEKLSLLKSSPNAIVEVVAPRFFELETLAASHGSVKRRTKVQSLDASQTPHGHCMMI